MKCKLAKRLELELGPGWASGRARDVTGALGIVALMVVWFALNLQQMVPM